MSEREGNAKINYVDKQKKSHRKYFFAALSISPAIAFLPVAPIAYMRIVFGPVINSDSLLFLISLLILLIFALTICGVLDYFRDRIILSGTISFVSKIEEQVYRTSLVGKQADWVSGTKMLSHLRSIRNFLKSPVVGAFFDAPFSMLLLLAIFFIHPLMGFFSLLGALMALIIGLYIEKKVEPEMNISYEAQTQSRQYLNSFYKNIHSCASAGNLPNFYKKWLPMQKRFLLYNADARGVQAFGSAITQNVMMIQGSMVLGVGAMLTLIGALPAYMAGNLIIAKFIGALAIRPMMMIIMSWSQVVAFRYAYKEIRELLSEIDEVNKDNIALPKPQGYLKAQGVTKVSASGKRILHNINFSSGPNSITSVIGQSGAGKTTLAKILCGIDQPTNGIVRLDEAEIYKWQKKDLASSIGYLPQNIELFGGSIMSNISRFEELNIEYLQDACEKADILDLFESYVEGEDIYIDADSLSISNGTKQKIGLARAFYGKPKFIVLDEPTSKLDSYAENKFLDSIKLLKKEGVCLIIITHNSKIIRNSDSLLMLDNGEQKMHDSTQNAFAKIREAVEKGRRKAQ